jgi:hypothetical protein
VSSYKRNCNMWFISALITMICIESFNWQHTRMCDWETFEGRKESVRKHDMRRPRMSEVVRKR